MRKRLSVVWSSCFLLLVLSSCGMVKVGTIPRGTPDTGDGTPSVVMTATPDLGKIPQAPASATGAYYAFVRQNQLWMARAGAAPEQATSFNFGQFPNVFWHRPLWSPNDKQLAFIVSMQATGAGGGGCGSAESGASGALYVLDTKTKQMMVLSVDKGAQAVTVQTQPPVSAQWQTIFWEDTTHLLAWYNGDTGNTSAAGLYRYDLTTHELKQVLSLNGLGNVSLSSLPEANKPLLLSLRYSSGQLYYQVVVHPFEQQSQLVIFRHSVVHPEEPGSQVLSLGQEAWCGASVPGAYSIPGWDVSPDGEQLVAQTIVSGDPNQGIAAIQVLDLKNAEKSELFSQLSSDLLAHDLALTWAPDNQTVVAAEAHPIIQRGPFSATLANPAALQQYAPTLSGQLSWRADSGAFALQRSDLADDTTPPAVYLFLSGDSQGRLLLTDAQEFSWG
jgi:hypothetical protein